MYPSPRPQGGAPPLPREHAYPGAAGLLHRGERADLHDSHDQPLHVLMRAHAQHTQVSYDVRRLRLRPSWYLNYCLEGRNRNRRTS